VQEDIAKLRAQADLLDSIPFTEKEILRLLNEMVNSLSSYWPKATVEPKKTNKWICNFRIKGLPIIMVERVHGSRNAIPISMRKKQINGIHEALDFAESCLE